MPDRRGSYIVVSCIPTVTQGKLWRLPVHITLLPWFTMPEDNQADFGDAVRQLSARFAPFKTRTVKTAVFGEGKDVHQVRIMGGHQLVELHQLLLRSMWRHGGEVRSPEFTGDGFIPHITKQKSGWIGAHEQVGVSSLQLAKAIEQPDAKRTIIGVYPLSGTTHA